MYRKSPKIGKAMSGGTIPNRYVPKRLSNVHCVILPQEQRDGNKNFRNRHDSYRTLEYEKSSIINQL